MSFQNVEWTCSFEKSFSKDFIIYYTHMPEKNGRSMPRSRLFWTENCSSLRSSDPQPSSWTSPTGTERPSNRFIGCVSTSPGVNLCWESIGMKTASKPLWVNHSNHSAWNVFRSYLGLLSKSRSIQYHGVSNSIAIDSVTGHTSVTSSGLLQAGNKNNI